jgi:hypothetical protein
MRTSELLGAELDWAVAKCEGATEEWRSDAPFLWDGVACIRIDGHDVNYRPSTDWAQGGPIIEREKLDVFCSGNVWDASTGDRHPNEIRTGSMPLIAAMRCYVASKLGDEVEIPTELTQGEKK